MQPLQFLGLKRGDLVLPIFVLATVGGLLASKWLGNAFPQMAWPLRTASWFAFAGGIAWWITLQTSELHLRAANFLFAPDGDTSSNSRRGACAASATAAFFFLALLIVLLTKNLPYLKSLVDIHWHMAFLDYDVTWRTPLFSLAGNILYHFDMQVPFNTNLAPLNGAVRLFAPEHRIAASFTLVSLGTGVLLWFIGWTAELRPVACTIFAGLTALIVTVPFGFDHLLPFLPPPFLFMSQAMLTTYWGEVGVLSLTTVLLFFWVGQCSSVAANVAISVVFTASCYLGLLAYPATAFFSLLVVAFYCLGFLVTTTANVREFWWKITVSIVVLALMLATHIPSFFKNLYSYSLGAYFSDKIMNGGRLDIWKNATMTSAFSFDPNFLLVSAIALGSALYFIISGPGSLRRLALAMLLYEAGIVTVGGVLAFLHYPISLYYSDQMQAPVFVGFFVLALLFAFVVLFSRGEEIFFAILQHLDKPRFSQWALDHRRALHVSALILIVAVSPLVIPKDRPFDNSVYPPAEPPSVKILEKDLSLAPGKTFGGRVLSLVRQDFPAQHGPNMAPLLIAVEDVFDRHYGRYTGNDHWFDLLHFNIPVVGEYAEWTTPINFLFLHEFFSRKDDMFEKALFVLRTYNERVARMIGIRYVVTDGDTVQGGIKVYEQMTGDTPLRLFRIDGTNLGQYSPTRAIRIATAADGLAALKSPTFDPQQDVLVEQDVRANLVPGTLQSLTVEDGPTLHVKATSPGTSLLVLPFEYSHCLRLKETGSTARLIPVNLQQTGLLFDGSADVEIDYRFGPFANPTCRGDDLARMDVLHVHDALK